MKNFQFASFWERFLASIIDSILLLMITGSIFYFIYGISFMEKISEWNTINIFLNYIVPFIGTLLFWHYTSSTPGKTFFQIKIVDAKTLEKPTTKQFMIRYVSYFISFVPFGLGFFWIIWNKKRQGWHDKLAGTVLIEPKTEPKKISFFGYIGRTIGISLGILFIMSMMFLLTIALLSAKGDIPDSNLYSVKRLDKNIAKELVEKKIINDTQELLYLNPNSYFSFTKSGTAIVKDGIISYKTLENEKSKSTKFYFKDISRLDLDVENIYLTMGMLMITIYNNESDSVLFDVLIPKNIKAEELKKEILDLWNAAKVFAIASYPSNINILEVLKLSDYVEYIRKEIGTNKDRELIADLVSIGYHNYIENKDLFSQYNSEVLKLLHDNTWKNKSMATSSKIWIDVLSKEKLNEESFDAFFEQIEVLDTLDKDSTWYTFAKRLPLIYLYFMDKQLQSISHSQTEVPLLELYKKDNSIIKDMNTSRHYLVSEVYVRMSEFCDDAVKVVCSDEEYAKKAVESSPLNPNALFRYAYESDDNPKSIEMLEDLLILTKTSEDLFDTSMDAVYNNLGYTIYDDEQVEKYDDALVYLQKAYDLDKQSVYSLSTMSGIYRERKDYKSAYGVMEREAYKFLHASDEELIEKENNYWSFARSLVDTSYEFKDYNTTKYVCTRYLKLHDSEYEECHEYLKEIKESTSDINEVAEYSFWKLYEKI